MANQPPSSAREAAQRARILVIDDDEDVLRSFSRVLSRAGNEVDEVSTGALAIERVHVNHYDALVCDISMPDISGIELLRRVRAIDVDLPVILATGSPALDSAIEAVELGATRYLTKPVAPAKLTEAVARAVQLRRISELRQKLAELHGGTLGIGDLVSLEARFENALENLYLDFQPIVSWSQKSIVGYEALVRSAEPKLAHPGALIDAAERLDRLHQLGRTVRGLCSAAASSAPPSALLFVNLHTRDLLDETLYEAGAPLSAHADRVVLEVTERAKLEQVHDIPGRMRELRRQGFRIAIDDIGAGYSGLSSFAQLEPEIVKLDMALVRDVDTRPMSQKLIKSLTTLCHDLGMRVVAEGVETVAERDVVNALGCDWLQGHLFAKPAPPFAAAVF